MTPLFHPMRRRCPLVAPDARIQRPPMARSAASGRYRRFVILQRDGVLLVRWPWLADPSGVELRDGAAQGLRRLQNAGFGLAVLTHQPGIGYGWLTYEQLYAVHEKMVELLLCEGVMMDGVYVCPHRPEDACDCHPSKANLLLRAAAELKFTPSSSFILAEDPQYLGLSQQVGIVSIDLHARRIGGACRAASVSQAADWILRNDNLHQAA